MAQATNELTPMRRQYQQIKDQHKDCILMFRLGDFYEMFDEDAKLTARELDLTLTTRDRGKPKEEQTPMCGVPYHSVDSYIARLVQKGYKVAICEQMEDPATAKGLVQRDITRIITPGTVTESCMLDENKNNYIGCIYGESGKFGLAFCDVSTGAFFTTVCSDAQNVASELGRFAPSEILRYGANVDCEVIDDAVFRRLNCCVSEGKQELFALESAEALLENHFHATLSQMGIAGMPAAVIASGALLQTLLTLQKNDLAHIRELQYYTTGRFMELDLDARRNLELTETMRSKEKRGTLLWVLDKTHTAMGGRMLRSWLEKPLLDPVEITRRHGAVEELTDNVIVRGELEQALRDVTDLERVQTRIVTGTVNCRDLLGLARGFRALPDVKAQLQKCDSPLLKKLEAAIDPLTDCADRIENTLVDDPPLTIREGGSAGAQLQQLVEEYGYALPTAQTLAQRQSMPEEEMVQSLEDLVNSGALLEILPRRYLAAPLYRKACQSVEQVLAEYHKANPLHAGMKVAALRQKALRGAELKEADAILTAMLRGGTVTAIADRCALPDFRVVLTKRQTALRQKLLDSYRKSGREVPFVDDLYASFPTNERDDCKKVLENLVSCGELVMLTPQLFYHKDVYEEVCALTRDFFEGHPAFTLAEYRDLLGTSRKYALAILEFFDKTKVTKMVGDHREVIGSL